MKVEVTYREEWRRKAVVEVDEAEVREWLGFSKEAVLDGVDVERFFEATDWERVNDLGLPPWQTGEYANLTPGERDDDEFVETDLDGVRIL